MKTLLIFPPASDPAHPPLGIASLAGYLQEQNKAVDLVDMNLLSYDYLLSKENLATCTKKIEERVQQLEKRPYLEWEQAEEYQILTSNVMAAPYLISAVPMAMNNIQNPDIYRSRELYSRYSTVIKKGMELVSAAHYPVRWYPRGFSMGQRPTSSSEVVSAINDTRQNLFLPFYNNSWQLLSSLNPDIIGISLNYYCQLIPALVLAKVIREVLPQVKIVVGGSLICFYEDRWEVLLPFKNLVDAWIPFEGELPLYDLITTLERSDPISSAKGVLTFDGDSPNIVDPPPPLKSADLPPPSFEGLPLDRYLSPEITLPVLTTRGCYWGKCAFCSHDRLYRGRFRRIPPKKILFHIKELSKRYDCNRFYFVDEAIPPDTADKLAEAVRNKELDISWFGEMRLESSLSKERLLNWQKGGCQMLMFGLESGTQRILDHMHKGIQVDNIEEILKNCSSSGIRSFIMFFIGFPTESTKEAQNTLDLICHLKNHITHIAYTNFILEHHTPVYGNYQAYGVKTISAYEGEDLKIYSRYEVCSGIDMEKALAILQDATKRKAISELIRLFALSRSHLGILPPKGPVKPGKQLHPPPQFNKKSQRPNRSACLVPGTLQFNLDEIKYLLTNPKEKQKAIHKNSTNYIYDAEEDRLLDVGPHGISLLKLCDGERSLDEIICYVGPHNQDVVESYYTDLTKKGMLTWN